MFGLLACIQVRIATEALMLYFDIVLPPKSRVTHKPSNSLIIKPVMVEVQRYYTTYDCNHYYYEAGKVEPSQVVNC